MTKYNVNNCHYFRETIDPNAMETKMLMAKAAVIIEEKGTVTEQPFCNRKIYTYKGVQVIEGCLGEYVIKVPEDNHGFPDRRYLEAIINNSEMHPLIIGNNRPSRV